MYKKKICGLRRRRLKKKMLVFFPRAHYSFVWSINDVAFKGRKKRASSRVDETLESTLERSGSFYLRRANFSTCNVVLVMLLGSTFIFPEAPFSFSSVTLQNVKINCNIFDGWKHKCIGSFRNYLE